MKKVAIIPALLNSKRVHNKNLILVDGFPLIYYVVNSCKKSGAFDEIYISSDDYIFKKMASDLGVNFYKRSPENGGSKCTMSNSSKKCKGERCTIHDHFLMDFISNVECDYLIQVHTTSPLIKPETISSFAKKLENLDSQISVEEVYSEAFYNSEPINFNISKKQETQSLKPILPITWALSGWKKDSFIKSYQEGPTFNGSFGLFPISKIEAIDVDTPEELFIAEACLSHLRRKESVGKFNYHRNIRSIESELVDLISLDGSPMPDKNVQGHNQTLMNLDDIEKKIGGSDWCYPVVYTDLDQVAFIKQSKGKGCRKHYHPTKDEWWVIFRGSFEYQLWHNRESPEGDPDEVIIASQGEIVFLPKGTIHVISCISEEPGVRLACGSKEMAHIYV